MSFETAVQSPQPGREVTLYQIDLTPAGVAQVLYYTPVPYESGDEGKVTFDGDDYVPWAMVLDDIEVSGQGSLPRPRLTISNVLGEFNEVETTYGAIEGAKVTCIRTFAQFLDDGDDPNPAATFPPDVFYIERVNNRDDVQVVLDLRSVIDHGDKRLPARQILRSACGHTYRLPDGMGGFNYTAATCPYTGTDYFDETDAVVSAGDDRCSKRLTGCVLRFGQSPLPTRAFPGAGRYG